MEKLYVNDNCIGCGMCVAIDPDHFAIVDGLSEATNSDNLDSEALKNAQDSCPTSAIHIAEESENKALDDIIDGQDPVVLGDEGELTA